VAAVSDTAGVQAITYRNLRALVAVLAAQLNRHGRFSGKR
jgi:hypothetical protein